MIGTNCQLQQQVAQDSYTHKANFIYTTLPSNLSQASWEQPSACVSCWMCQGHAWIYGALTKAVPKSTKAIKKYGKVSPPVSLLGQG